MLNGVKQWFAQGKEAAAEAAAMLKDYPAEEAWQLSRRRSRDGTQSPAYRKRWYRIARAIQKQTGRRYQADTATRYLDGL